jgi:hypothetical protein
MRPPRRRDGRAALLRREARVRERPLKTTSMVLPYGAERTIPPTGPLQS